MDDDPTPLQVVTDTAAWFRRASAQGVPAIAPCTWHGHAALGCGTWTWQHPGLNAAAHNPNRNVRALIAIEACRLTRAMNEANGARHP